MSSPRGSPQGMHRWIEENKSSFVPPVCNKLMYGAGQLKVMFIGGPNVRKDYHMEEGEEIFYQVKGDMVLKIVEKGVHKDVTIKEGEIFVLPCRIPHSPQRFENTVGLVIERERLDNETDGLRYYADRSTDILWEEWFHCFDLGTQLGPVIKKFFASQEHATGKLPEGKTFAPPPFELDTTTSVMKPFDFNQWIKEHRSEFQTNTGKALFGKGEFEVVVLGEGIQQLSGKETFLWQLEGETTLEYENGVTKVLKSDDVILITAEERCTVKRSANSVGVSVITNPLACK
ncbi:3-hydroxyanthranilate 3,4-dioxygenase-like [Dysidea avara]|uniref:3-hydroxyanthranilate 3,4-dioxygenase-like n=1 Tax=Dysidea avara TaxID=196820 RepID=UPI003327B4DA